MPRFPTVPNITRAIGHAGAGLYNAVTPRTHEPSGAVAPQSASSYLRSTLQSINPTTPSGALNIAGILVPGPGGKGLRMQGRMSPAQNWHLAKLGNVSGGKFGTLTEMADSLKGHPLAEQMFRQILSNPKLFRHISRTMHPPYAVGQWAGRGPDPMNESLQDVVGLSQMMRRLGVPTAERTFPLEQLEANVTPKLQSQIPPTNPGIGEKPTPADLFQTDAKLGLEPGSYPFWTTDKWQQQEHGPYTNPGRGLDQTQFDAGWWQENWGRLKDEEKTALARVIANIVRRNAGPPGGTHGTLGTPESN